MIESALPTVLAVTAVFIAVVGVLLVAFGMAADGRWLAPGLGLGVLGIHLLQVANSDPSICRKKFAARP